MLGLIQQGLPVLRGIDATSALRTLIPAFGLPLNSDPVLVQQVAERTRAVLQLD